MRRVPSGGEGARSDPAAAGSWQHLMLRVAPWAPAVGIAFAVVAWVVYRRGYVYLTSEDRPVEWLTVLVYGLAAVGAVATAINVRRSSRTAFVIFSLAAFVLLVVAAEEMSWGQRQLGFTGPESLVKENLQREANVHNLVDQRAINVVYVLVGLYGAGLGRQLVRRLPFLARDEDLYGPERVLAPAFLTLAVFFVVFEILDPNVTRLFGDDFDVDAWSKLEEVAELLLAVTILVFLIRTMTRSRSRGRSPSVPAHEALPPS